MPGLVAVSFDANGTLMRAPRLGELYAEVLARHGIAASPERLGPMIAEVWQERSVAVRFGSDRFAGHPQGARGFWREFLNRVAARLELPTPSPFAAAELFDRFARPDAWELFPEARATLETLAGRGFRLGVVSNFDERLPRILDGLGIGPLLATIVPSVRVGVEKPHPAIFEQLLDELGATPEGVLHVGDDRRLDVEGARALGMPALHLRRHGPGGDLATLAGLLDRPELAAPRRRPSRG